MSNEVRLTCNYSFVMNRFRTNATNIWTVFTNWTTIWK